MRRSRKQERLDTGDYTPEEYQHCLVQLGRVGKLLGGDRATLAAFAKLEKEPTSILDVGCGGGDFAITLAKRYPNAQVIGTDICEEALAYAKAQDAPAQHAPANVSFCKSYEEPVDLVTCTLMCHHLTDDELIAFLKQANSQATQAVIINDLQRSPIAYTCFATLSPFLFRSRLIFEDGLLSIRRSLTKKEWTFFLDKAGIERYSVKWNRAFRWIISWNVNI